MIVPTVLMEMGFNKIIDKLMENFIVNTSAAKEHIYGIQRTIRTVKERTIFIVTNAPLNFPHKILITNTLYFSVLWLNAFRLKWNIGKKFNEGYVGQESFILKNTVSQYLGNTVCEVHNRPDRYNTMTSRTNGFIALGPIGNLNGIYKFFYLKTGHILKWRKCTD